MRFKGPMLAPAEQAVLSEVQYPVVMSPKYDGFRALTLPGVGGRTRNLKPVQNRQAAAWLRLLPPHLDGELVAGSPTERGCFKRTSSMVTARGGGIDGLAFYVFDWTGDLRRGYRARHAELSLMLLPEPCVLVGQAMIHNAEQAKAYEDRCLREGYEGAMIRALDAPYKCGRCTVKEGYLLKRKLTLDGEARILEVLEARENLNEPTRDRLGRAKRSHRKEGMRPKGTAGGFRCEDLATGVEFNCGAGEFTHEEMRRIWRARALVPGRILKYRYDPSAGKKPRFPRALGFRSRADFQAPRR